MYPSVYVLLLQHWVEDKTDALPVLTHDWMGKKYACMDEDT